jgi:hypothetical protein
MDRSAVDVGAVRVAHDTDEYLVVVASTSSSWMEWMTWYWPRRADR